MADTKIRRLHPGDPAPDYELCTPDDAPARLRDLWEHGPTLLTFLRHFG
ncbi:MAG: hypothetical protein JW910_08395 [Anaerolineae bacterium]|nr:hypothetical protein [Anaerolineae bacterium]